MKVTTEEAVKIEVDEEDRKSTITLTMQTTAQELKGQTILTVMILPILEHTDALDLQHPMLTLSTYMMVMNLTHYEGW